MLLQQHLLEAQLLHFKDGGVVQGQKGYAELVPGFAGTGIANLCGISLLNPKRHKFNATGRQVRRKIP